MCSSIASGGARSPVKLTAYQLIVEKTVPPHPLQR